MHAHKKITQIAANIWRVDRWKEIFEARESWFVSEPDEKFVPDAAWTFSEDGNGFLHFCLHGRTVLAEADTPFTQGFAIGETDALYGLGMHQQQAMNRRHMVCQMVQVNADSIAVPFLTSNAGYAILFDTCAYMSIGIDKPCTTDYAKSYDTEEETPNRIQIFADDADVFTYYVILGDTMDEQIHGYRWLTGKSTLLPRWALGYFQSREHYATQKQLLETAHEFRRRSIPLDCIVQDWHYWGKWGWNAVRWDTDLYPDPKAMTDELHGLDMKILLSVWSGYAPESDVCQELEDHHMILHLKNGKPGPWGQVHDAFNPAASDVVWKYMKKNLYDAGIDAWWLDSTEPALGNDTSLDLLETENTCRGDNRRFLNAYALTVSRNLYRHLRETSSEQRVCILTRSGYAGLQTTGASSWTGDVVATWDVFKKQIPALLSYSASGLPYSTTDIGGFFVNMPACGWDGLHNPEYKELYTRWFWFGVFSPLFRSHGTSAPREMWHFGEPGTEYYDAQMTASRLRYALLPYLYAAAFRVYAEDATLMRPLAMDFPNDPRVLDIEDTYLFGDSLLVHIVTDYACRRASVYLPSGADWVDFYTGERYTGGQTVEVDAPLDRTPLFVKAGSIVLMTEPAECTARQKEDVLRVQLYPGRDAETFYYRDDGDNYSYENGRYAKIPFTWEDEKRILHIGAPTGQPGAYDLHKTIEVYVDGKQVTTASYTEQPLDLVL